MKKWIYTLALIIFMTGCGSVKANDIPLSNVIEEIKVVAEFENSKSLDLTNQKVAAEYGIDTASISEGYVYYSDNANADEVIIVRASSQEKVEEIEKAVAVELNTKANAWKSNKTEDEKIKNHIMRTIGDCVLLAIGDKSAEIDNVFNQLRGSKA